MSYGNTIVPAKTAEDQQVISMLGISLQKLTMPTLLELISDSVRTGKKRVLANHNLHSVYLYHNDARMRSFYAKSDSTFIDGMSLVFLGRLMGHSLSSEHRLTCLDWIPQMLEVAAREGWRVFHLGAEPAVAEKGTGILKSRFPDLQIASLHGFFDATIDSEENQEVVSAINEFQPHILMVGMGMPRQEQWIAENMEELKADVITNVGAYIHYIAGDVPTPPRWLGRLGLEWLYRLLSEPTRLWRRYLVEPWFLMGLVARDVVGRLRR